MAESASLDVVIIGAGHNGLTCAGYLARKGLKVGMFERRNVVGGAAVTEEFHPGFRNSTCSYAVSLLHPKIIRDLELERHGLDIQKEEHPALIFGANGDYFFACDDEERFVAQVAAQAPDDVERYFEFAEVIERAADVLRDVSIQTPPNIGGGLRDLWRAGIIGNRIRKLDLQLQREIVKLFTMSVRDYLEQWFSGELLLAIEGYASQVGNLQSVRAGGTAFVLLHHMFGVVNGVKGAWGHVRGGMGSITQAMARSAGEHGAEIEVGAPVESVVVEGGRAVGVRLEDGREVRGRAVAANVNPKLLFDRLVPPGQVSDDFSFQMKNYRCVSGTFRMNVALDELPRFTALGDVPDYEYHLQGSVFIANSLDYYEQAYQDAMTHGWARRPVVHMLIPSIIDDSLAPPGKHVASMFCQHFNPELPNGQSWDEVKEEVADLLIETVNEYAPNFAQSVVGRMALSPLDLEREFGLVGGDIFHGCVQPDQMFSLRPTAGYADYRMPVKGLYLCGSGAHPGGGVTGCPGHNAAREIMKDIR